MKLFDSLHLRGFLSFGPESEPIELRDLNVLIGPNGVGKSNFIEAIEVLHATPTDLAAVIRIGGTPGDWIWRGSTPARSARVEATLAPNGATRDLRYALEFTELGGRLEIVDELLEESHRTDPSKPDVFFYYRFQDGRPAINVREAAAGESDWRERRLKRANVDPQQSILSQVRDPDLYPEISLVARQLAAIQVFREWSFGRSAPLRAAQPANLPSDVLLPQLVNLGLVLNDLEHRPEWARFEALMTNFLPRFRRVSTKVSAGSVQIFLHEDGLSVPTAATRLSDGTLRFLTLLAILVNSRPPPVICIEEPELGLHPDVMSLLGELLIEASTRTQLIVTTHSDALVSALSNQPESVLVCDYLRNGTVLRRLEADALGHWLQEYRLGEVWRIGELGGNLW